MLNQIECQIIDNIAVGISIFSYKDDNLKLIAVNKRLEKMFGLNKCKIEEYTNKNISFIHPDDQYLVEIVLEKLKNNYKNVTFTARYYNYISRTYHFSQVEVTATLLEDRSVKMFMTYNDASFLEETVINNFLNLENHNNNLLKKLGIAIWKYDIEKKEIYDYKNFMNFNENIFMKKIKITNVPTSIIEKNIIHKDDVKTYKKMYEELFSGNNDISCDIRIFFEDINDYKWVRISYNVYKNSFNNYSQTIGTMKDITEEVLAKKYYNDLTSFWKNRSKDLILSSLVDLTDNKILGIKGEYSKEFISNSVSEFFSNIINSLYNNDFKNTKFDFFSKKNLFEKYNTGQKQIEEEWKIKVNNKKLWTKLTLILLKNPYNKHIMVNINIDNINKQKIIDEILSFVVENEFDYLTRADYKNNEFLVYFNHFEEFEGIEKKVILNLEEYKKLITVDLINEDSHSEKASLFKIFHSLKTVGTFKRIYKVYDKNKNIRVKEIKVSSIDIKKGIFYILRRDITDIYNENEKKNLILKEALNLAEKANKTKTIFLSTMSHDIRTPMNAIIGMTDLTYNLIGKDNEQVRKNLDIIKDSSKNLMTLINEVLNMNRINSGKVEFSLDGFNINHLARKVLKPLEIMAEMKNQKIYTHLNVKHNYLLGDSSTISRVANNLVENAIKYTPNGGKINIFISETFKKTKKDFAFFEIKVKDSGIGISKGEFDKIFDPFYRGKNAKNQKGTGLGLSIAKGIIELRGGTFKVESEIGKGSTFTINISFKIDPNHNEKMQKNIIEKSIEISTKPLNFKNKKVLLVEDNGINRFIARKNLEKYNLIVEEAIDGKKGFKAFINSPKDYFSLILMDVRMPILDGLKCCEKIRNSKHPNGKSIPIIALTADAFTQDKNKCFDVGMNDYMSKPINISELQILLKKHL